MQHDGYRLFYELECKLSCIFVKLTPNSFISYALRFVEKVHAVSIVIPCAESLTVEFKSDRNGYPDRELIEALTCLANTSGGELWLGVEDDATPSGLHLKHQNTIHLQGLIAEQTMPPLVVSIDLHCINQVLVAQIHVPRAPTLVATYEGVYLKRRLKQDGTPECIRITPEGDNLDRLSGVS